MRLIIVRHAESEGNRTGYFEGSRIRGGSSLTEEGILQAQLLAAFLSRQYSVSGIYSSPAVRAVETADILNREFNVPFGIIDELREIDCGDWEDSAIDFVKNANPDEWRVWKSNPTEFCFPRGESLLDVKRRIRPYIRGLLENSRQQTWILVSHSTTISIILVYLHDWPLQQAWLDRRSFHKNTAFTILNILVGSTQLLSTEIASTTHLEFS